MTISELSFVEEGHHLTLPCTVAAAADLQPSKATALVDTGATACFMDGKFVEGAGIPLKPLRRPRALRLADPSKAPTALTHYVEIDLLVGRYIERRRYYIVPSLNYPIILGID